MRDIEDSHSKLAVELGKQAEDFRLGDDVQGTSGLIGDEERRSVEDGHGDDDALGLAYAQLGRPATQKIAVVRETKIRERQSAFARTALPDESENFALAQFHENVAQDSRLVAVVDGEPKRQKWRSFGHFCAPKAGSAPKRSSSAFQKACGSKTEGEEPTTAGEIADMASLFTRYMKGCCSATICCTLSQSALRFLSEKAEACARIRRSSSASHGVAGFDCLGFH